MKCSQQTRGIVFLLVVACCCLTAEQIGSAATFSIACYQEQESELKTEKQKEGQKPVDEITPDDPESGGGDGWEKQLLRAVNESRQIYSSEMFPLQEEARIAASSIGTELNSQRRLISQLKNIDKSRLEQIRTEIMHLSSRVEMLKTLENVLTDMDDDAKEKAMEKAADLVTDLEGKRIEIQRPLMEDLSNLQRFHSDNNQPFADHFKALYRETGEGEFATYKRNYLNSNYVSSQVSARYQRDKDTVTVSIVMTGRKRYASMLKQKKEKLAGKYPILNLSNRNLMVIVGDVQVTVNAGHDIGKDDLKEFALNVLDFEKLAEVMAMLEPISL